MTPEYIEELADMADPQGLWRTPVLDQRNLPAHLKAQLDAGVALRRHADHVRRLNELVGTKHSLLITPLSANGVAVAVVLTPTDHLLLKRAR